MKKLIIMLFLLTSVMCAQSFTVKTHHLEKEDVLGSEMIYEMKIINTSSSDLTLYLKRAEKNHSSNWSSSLCFTSCFAPFLDSIATTTNFGSKALSPGDSIEVSLHIFPKVDLGTGTIKLEIGNVNNSSDVLSFVFTAKAVETTGISEISQDIPNDYYISQNYPNPFNPTTKIHFGLNKEGNVKIDVYNIIGQKVGTLVNKQLAPGKYSTNFDAKNLTSGIYIYKMQINNYVELRKMILEK